MPFNENIVKNEGVKEFYARVGMAGNVALYGAGDYAEMYYSILERLDIYPSIVIVTAQNKDLFHDIPIVSADNVELEGDELIIGAYDGASEETIMQRLGQSVNVLVLSDEDLFSLYNEIILRNILETLGEEGSMKKSAPALENFKKILVIRLDALGDAVMTTAFIRELKVNCPNADVSLMVRPSNVSLFDKCPYISNLISYDCKLMAGTLASQVRAQQDIENRIDKYLISGRTHTEYDAIFLPRELLKGRNCYEEFLLAQKIPSTYRLGRVREFEKDQKVLEKSLEKNFVLIKQNTILHETEYMLEMIKNLGGTIKDKSLEIWGAGKLPDEIVGLFQTNKKFVVLGAKASSPSRTWPVQQYSKLIELMYKRYRSDVMFLILGDTSSSEGEEELVAHDNVIDLSGRTTLGVVGEIMKKSVMYVGSNTGLMHMAAAAHLPCITLYATLPDIKKTDGNSAFRMGAWDTEHIDIIPPKALGDCKEMCKKPYAHCITQISVEKVYNEAISILDNIS